MKQRLGQLIHDFPFDSQAVFGDFLSVFKLPRYLVVQLLHCLCYVKRAFFVCVTELPFSLLTEFLKILLYGNWMFSDLTCKITY